MNPKKLGKYEILAIAITVISIIYWSAFSVSSYNSYHEYVDLASFAYDMHYHIAYPAVLHGLQYFVFANHVSFDLLLLLPVYAIFPSPLTLLIVQVILLSFTGLAVFYVARKLISSERTAFLLSLAFLINPSVISAIGYDFHLEPFIPLLMLLSFYFFMERKAIKFFISTALLLCLIDVVPFVALALGVALFAYTFSYSALKEAKKIQRIMAASMIALSVLMLEVYNGISSTLTRLYASNSYATLPLLLKIIPYDQDRIGLISSYLSYSGFLPMFTHNVFYILSLYTTPYSLLVVLFSFGIAAITAPISLLILAFPWLTELFLFGNTGFVFIFNHYFSLVIGGVLVAALISLMNFEKAIKRAKDKGIANRIRRRLYPYIDYFIVISIIVLLFGYFNILHSTNIDNLAQRLLLTTSPQEHAYDLQLDSMISRLPQNGSVMVPYFALSHVTSRQYIETIPAPYFPTTLVSTTQAPGANSTLSIYESDFNPSYIVTDPDPYIEYNPVYFINFQSTLNSTQLSYYGQYRIYARNGTATLLVSNSTG